MAYRSTSRRLTPRSALAGLATATAGALPPLPAFAARGDDELDRDIAVEVTARPIPSFGGEAGQTRFGNLQYRGGVSLYGNSQHFGGLSGLVVAGDGRKLLAITDVGNWLSAEITYDGTKPTGLKSARMGVPIIVSRNGLTAMGHQRAETLGMTLFGRAAGRHFLCYTGFERFDAEAPPSTAPLAFADTAR